MGKGGINTAAAPSRAAASKANVKFDDIPPAHVIPPGCPLHARLTIRFREAVGWILTANFLVFWALPIAGQGILWKHVMRHIMRPIFYVVDHKKSPIRWIATNYVYKNPRHADYAVTSLLVALSAITSLGFVFWYQLTYGKLTWTVIMGYYWAWVGLGGRQMGGAYTLAHKEGHNQFLYQPWIRSSVGNFFENWLGFFYGNVPHNFTTSHISIHHKLQAGKGDTFYQWDIDRTSWRDFMLYIYRISTHMVGFSSLYFFRKNQQTRAYEMLKKGMIYYWIVMPGVLYLTTRSPSFIFFIYLQPCCAMMYFLAFINIGLHAYIEFDHNGAHLPMVNSSAVIDGDDDYFGEDDHLAHHYATNVYYKDLPLYREKVMNELKKHHGSVFNKFSILEHSLFLLIKDWKLLAQHYVDFTEKMSQEEIIDMLKTRAVRKEISYYDYEFKWLPKLKKNHWMSKTD
ncbi:hypothetical protein AAMO2058_000923300 [Amorphochlora amoebiformis]